MREKHSYRSTTFFDKKVENKNVYLKIKKKTIA